VKKATANYLDIEIDKLTNSIENIETGEVFDTEISIMNLESIKLIVRADWKFDWRKEIRDNTKEVYKLSTVNNHSIIHGLASIEDKGDHVFLHLVESAKFNKGRSKIYAGVPGNLVAFACKYSFGKGYNGFVAFDSKSALIEHYKKSLNAVQLVGQRMYINDTGAKMLVSKYFKQ
jgi:hypothetical protein